MVGSVARSAVAACVAAGSPGFSNPVGQTVACVTVTNTSFAGFINNAGTVTPGGIALANGTITGGMSGGIIDSGTILAGGSNVGISVDANSQINAFAPIAIDGTGKTFTGGITNAGRITGSTAGIVVYNSSLFAGGITNSGVLSAPSGEGIAIYIHGVTTFSGGISNSGTIAALNQAVVVNGFAGGSIFSGGINNGGTITAGQTAVLVGGSALNVSGGVSNSGTISAGSAGIDVAPPTFSGGVDNTGTVMSTGGPGIAVGITADVTSFSGGISNAVGATISTPRTGIAVEFVENYSGGITNSGTITAGGSRAGILVAVASTFAGGIVNSGTISGGGVGMALRTVTLFANDIVNAAGGTISGAHTGIALNNVSAFAGSITNSGLISGAKGIVITGGSFGGAIVNYGTITGTGGTAIDVSGSGSDVTIVNDGGTINGTILFSSHDDLLYGYGTINGNLNLGNAVIEPTLATNSGGVLRVTGSYTQTATSLLAVSVNPTANAQLSVGGSASLDGFLRIYYLPGYYTSKTYTLISAGSVTGQFYAVGNSPPPAGTTQTISYTATSVNLTLTGSGTVGYFSDSETPDTSLIPGASANQQSVANSINNFFFSGGTLPAGFANLSLLSDSAALRALDQLSGEVGTSFISVGFEANSLFLNSITNPFNLDRGSSFGPAQAFATEERTPSALSDDIALAYASILREPGAARPTIPSRWSAWGAAYGGSGSIGGDPSAGSHNTSSQVFGFTGGLDYRLTPDVIVGLALGGGGSNWAVSQGLGTGYSNMFQAGIYGSERWGPFYLTGAFADSVSQVTTNRTITISGIDVLSANFPANVVSARLEGGYRYGIGGFGVTPYAAFQPQLMQLASYGENVVSGSPQFSLSYPARYPTDLRTEVGSWFDESVLLDRGSRLQLYARAAWAHDSGDGTGATALFQSLPGASFVVNGAKPDDDGAIVTVGAKYSLIDGWSIMANFDGEFSGNTSIYSGTAILRKTW